MAKPDENVANWHHYELGSTKALPYHWDRYLFRLVCYMETSLIHESVKEKIFDMTMIKTLSDGTKSETRDYKLSIGDQGGTSGEIPESVVPTPASYRDATSPTPRRKPVATIKVQQSEDADASQPSEMAVEHGENADASQASAQDGAQGEDADANVPEVKAAENKRIEEIMRFVTEIYLPDASKMIMRDNRQFVFPHGLLTGTLLNLHSVRRCIKRIGQGTVKKSRYA